MVNMDNTRPYWNNKTIKLIFAPVRELFFTTVLDKTVGRQLDKAHSKPV